MQDTSAPFENLEAKEVNEPQAQVMDTELEASVQDTGVGHLRSAAETIPLRSEQLTFEMRKLSRGELAMAQKFYSQNGYMTLVKPIDSVFGAFVDGRLVGVARLSPEYEVYVLKGINVAESYRHKGIGRRLAQLALDEMKDRVCFMAVVRDELQFYTSLGFSHLEADRAPDHLRRKFEQNRRKLKEIFLLKRPAQLS